MMEAVLILGLALLFTIGSCFCILSWCWSAEKRIKKLEFALKGVDDHE